MSTNTPTFITLEQSALMKKIVNNLREFMQSTDSIDFCNIECMGMRISANDIVARYKLDAQGTND